MKVGDKVTIYEDPITCKKQEGIAKLVRHVKSDPALGTELWYVRFPSDPTVEYQRWIKKPKGEN